MLFRSEAHINNLAERVGRRQSVEIVKHTRSEVGKMVDRVEALAENQLPAMLAEARQTLADLLGAEQERLSALATVNPNIRQEEIDNLAQNRAALEHHLESASLKLDAIRVIVAT